MCEGRTNRSQKYKPQNRQAESPFNAESMSYLVYEVTNLIVYLARVAIGECLATALALEWLVRGVQVLYVNAEVRLATAFRWAQLARVHGLVHNCNHNIT